jgi:hypothetical protein
MLKRFYLIVVLLFVVFTKSQGQTYGNEWINFNQKYSKITVSEESIFKITFDQVASKNYVAGNLNPAKFQIFNKGVEINLFITGTEDGIFNAGDMIYFYGNKNDASLDKILYSNINDLPNEEVSLFTDNSYYFLTYNLGATNGLRYDLQNLTNSGLTAESFIITKNRINLSSNYYNGEYILEGMSLSEYIEGEGYLGTVFGKGQSQNYPINTTDLISTSSFSPKISFYTAGRSNAVSNNSTGKNHHFRLSLNTTTLFDSLYRGYASLRKTITFQLTNSSNTFSVSSVDDLGAITDFQALGYLEVKYPRGFNLNNISSLNFNLNSTKALALLNFNNSNLSNPYLIEKNGNSIFIGKMLSSQLSFIVNNGNTEKNYFLADFSNSKSAGFTDVIFKNHNPSFSKNYLLITHQNLNDGALAYQQYNQSIGMPTAVAFTDDLYNEFYYGFHHSMAIRNFCQYMIEKGNTKPEYLLLLGKGFETPKNNLIEDLVPTYGYPASDNMLTSGFNGSNLEPGLNTGRIPARSNIDITNYLNKLKTYNALPNELWRKTILQATGGTSIFESTSFRNYQSSFFDRAKSVFFGANRSRILKDVTTPITENQTERINKELKGGVSLVSYFGHGSATGTEISFGKAEDQQNKEKPTIFLVNGCSTGACFSATKSLGELYILAKDVGAVGWIGTTSEGVASYLGNASANYHGNWFNNYYGQSITKGIKEGLKTFQNGNDKLNKAHTRQYIWLGDPYLKFYSPIKPDFVIKNNYLFATTANQNATSNSLFISLIIENLGKTSNDSLTIQIKRTLPNNSIITLPNFKIKPVFNRDTLKFELNNLGLNTSGINKIEINVDPINIFDESNKLNNKANLDIFLPGNGVKTLFPLNNGIYSKALLVLKAEPDDMHTKNAEYMFEIDTVATYDSNFKRSSDIIVSGVLPVWQPNVSMTAGKVYYWRVKLNLPLLQGGNWSTSSFTFNPNITDGFSQSHKNQLSKITTSNIVYDINNGKFEFGKSFFPTSIYTEGDDGVEGANKRFRTDQSISFSDANFEGFTLVAMSNLRPNSFVNYPSPFNSTNGPKVTANGYKGQFYWNINVPAQVDSMIRFINQIPSGYHVIGFNGRNVSIKDLPIEAKNALKTFGLLKFDLIDNGEPYMFWGIKGNSSGSALEFTADYSSLIPPRKQTLQYFNSLDYPLSNGSITTEAIGPAQEWKKISINFNKNTNDMINYDVIGVNIIGNETKIFSSVTTNDLDISAINAITYPFVKLKFNIKDDIEFTVPSIKNITLDYKPLPELTINTDFKDSFYSKKIQEGDSLKWDLGISNIYDYPMNDSLSVSYTITKQNQTSQTTTLKKIAPLNAGQSIVIGIKESTISRVGNNSVRLKINGLTSDLYQFNNEISNEFEIIGDKQQPIVNVLFDGKSIINGEIISPTPLITISTIDENKYLLLNDTSFVNIYLKKKTDLNFKKISFSSGLLLFKASTSGVKNQSQIEFTPEFIENGTYTLNIKSKDGSGNFNLNNYEIDFDVINESSITNFYPYPNPVVNNMKFVFTLTGSKIPDKIKIQIYNQSGKIVRTILKNELGYIRIGNNISDFSWDGTDEFGDRLANGIYLYKVDIEDLTDYKMKYIVSDKNFKNNIGKIYLLK